MDLPACATTATFRRPYSRLLERECTTSDEPIATSSPTLDSSIARTITRQTRPARIGIRFVSVKRWPLLALAALVLAGCGSGTGGTSTGSVTGAARRTLALSWGRYDLTFAHPTLFEPSIRVVGGRAAFNFTDRLAYETIDLERAGASQLLWLDLTPTTLLVDPQPPPSGLLPAGKIWISVDSPAQAAGLTPELALDEIAWAARTATHIGSSVSSDHVPQDEYRVTVDLDKALVAATKANLADIASAIDGELQASKSSTLSLSVWVNGPGYVSRIDETVPGSRFGAISLVFTSFRLRYTGTLPPLSQEVPLSSLKPSGRSVWAVATGS